MSTPININVTLINAAGTVMQTVNNVSLSTSGTTALINFSSLPNGSYYIKVKGANFIETWSKNLVSFATGTANYNFKTAITQAYGNNMLQIGFAFAFYVGDVNQSGCIDISDITQVYNKAVAYQTGVEDLNGDGIVDIVDILLVYKNGCNFVCKSAPF